MPDGTDTVVVQEDCTAEDGYVVVTTQPQPGRHIRRRGLDFAEGQMLLPAGRRLTARDIGLAAAMNYAVLPVHRRPRVALFATGDELAQPGTMLDEGQIVSSNGPYLAAALAGEGAEVIDLGLVPDRLEATVAAVQAARRIDADVLVSTGGASVGEHDLVVCTIQNELLRCGATADSWTATFKGQGAGPWPTRSSSSSLMGASARGSGS